MKRFDDWAKSSARRAAEPAPEQAQGISRREMLKKAGIVGAATVWATPVVQSVMAPASAQVSPPPIPTCTAPDGSCGSPTKNCTSVCPPDANRACADNSDCDGNCSTGSPKVCVKAPVGGHCYSNTGCTQNRCNTVTQTCLTGATGATCTANSQCVTGKCQSGTCAQSNAGCYTTADCNGSRVCVGGSAFTAGTCSNI